LPSSPGRGTAGALLAGAPAGNRVLPGPAAPPAQALASQVAAAGVPHGPPAPLVPPPSLRIVPVNTEHTWRGGERQVFNLMTGLRGLGHDVELVALPDSALTRRSRDAGLTVTEMAMRSDADAVAAWKLARHLRRRPCDVLHAQTARAHSLALGVRALGGAPRVVVSRRIDFPVRKDPLNRWKYRSRLVSRYIAVAGVIRDVLIQAGVDPGRIEVIHSSIDLSRFDGVGDQRAAVRAELGIPA